MKTKFCPQFKFFSSTFSIQWFPSTKCKLSVAFAKFIFAFLQKLHEKSMRKIWFDLFPPRKKTSPNWFFFSFMQILLLNLVTEVCLCQLHNVMRHVFPLQAVYCFWTFIDWTQLGILVWKSSRFHLDLLSRCFVTKFHSSQYSDITRHYLFFT